VPGDLGQMDEQLQHLRKPGLSSNVEASSKVSKDDIESRQLVHTHLVVALLTLNTLSHLTSSEMLIGYYSAEVLIYW
jgi:hypothetical protein